MNKFKEFDYDDAIIDFEKALKIEPEDKATHFNLACALSLTENKKKAFSHLEKAVKYGLKDVNKIKNHDALAFLRIQDEWEAFEKNGFKMSRQYKTDNLLDQIKNLASLKDRGMISEMEFVLQKKKLLE